MKPKQAYYTRRIGAYDPKHSYSAAAGSQNANKHALVYDCFPEFTKKSALGSNRVIGGGTLVLQARVESPHDLRSAQRRQRRRGRRLYDLPFTRATLNNHGVRRSTQKVTVTANTSIITNITSAHLRHASATLAEPRSHFWTASRRSLFKISLRTADSTPSQPAKSTYA